jgi:SWI/SNF-related matrix-associated actin-dependent regulator of chromatin subfamily A3
VLIAGLAHWIRNQNSQQFRASEKLLAQRRWCLTGTPIQNRLDDLLSLLRFLHFEPFCRPSIFQKHVLAPLSQENSEGSKMLHVLLRGICLRRNEKYLELSEPRHQEIKLTLSTEEKTMYDEVLRRFQEDLDNLVSNQSKTKKYAILFTMVMKLRRLCNHGTMYMTEQLLVGAATELDPDTFCDYCQGPQQDNLAILNRDQVCPECNKIISASSQKSPEPHCAESQAFSTNLPTCRDFVMGQTAGNILPRPRPMIRKPSTKLAAVVANLKTEPPGSKR